MTSLLGRSQTTLLLLRAVSQGSAPRADFGPAQIQRIRESEIPAVTELADNVFGKPVKPSSQEKEGEIARVKKIVTTGAGDASAGAELFAARCAVCHTLFGRGAKIGPDLTSYNRRDVDFLLLSIIDPSAYVREEYTAFAVRARGGQTLVGLITERGANQITLVDAAGQKTSIARDQIVLERALRTSLMPEGLLGALSDQQLRGLFKYISADKPPAQVKLQAR